jgi:Arc/MetJ-type ribon-helix-helix transcriptional regulator
MSLILPKELDEWVRAEVAAGRARSAEDLTRDALEAHKRRIEAFRTSLQEAEAEADRDGWLEGDAVLAEMDEMISTYERESDQAAQG